MSTGADRLSVSGLVLVMALGTAGAASAAGGAGSDGAREAGIAGFVSGLNYPKLRALYGRLGVEPAAGFHDCLCPGGYHFSPGPTGPCRRIGPLGGVSWAAFDADPGKWQACMAGHAPGIVQAIERETRSLFDAPAVDGYGVAGGTIDIPTTPVPARAGPVEHPLRTRFRELEALCLPVPANLDELFSGPVISQFWRADLLAEVEAMFDEPRSLCEIAIESKLLLDGERGRYLSDLAVDAGWELWGLDEWTGYQSVAELGETLFRVNDSPLGTRIGFLGTLADLRSLAELADSEYQTHRRNVRARAVAEEYRQSAGWDNARVDGRVDELGRQIVPIAQQINALQAELAQRLRALEPGEREVRVYGGPFVPNTRVPNDALIWQAYFREAEAVANEYEARIRPLIFSMTELEMKAAVLRNYRRPLNTMTCEEFIESRRELCRQ